jgi:WhiB family redox-sensing transcriptional regulator
VDDPRLAWLDNAACRPYPTEMFFPIAGEDTSKAREVCLGCPVSLECLDFALRSGQKHGIWGGTSERERRRINTLRRLSG